MGKKSRRPNRPSAAVRRERSEQNKASVTPANNNILDGDMPAGDTGIPHHVAQVVASAPTLREKVNRLRDAFLTASKDSRQKWNPERIDLFIAYQDFMRRALHKTNDVDFGTKDDYAFLKGVYKNPTELAFLRAFALQSWANLATCQKFAWEDTCHCMLLALKHCDEAEAEFRMHGNYRYFFGQVTRMKEALKSSLLKQQADTKCLKLSDGTSARILTKAGNQQCGACFKIVENLETDIMQCCDRCQLTYYCSKECQKLDWNENGHKYLCRKTNEFKAGDTAIVADPSDSTLFAREVVLQVAVTAPKGKDSKPKKWLVKGCRCYSCNVDGCCNCNDQHVAVVPTKYLRRVRPLFWEPDHQFWKRGAVGVINRFALEMGDLWPPLKQTETEEEANANQDDIAPVEEEEEEEEEAITSG